MKSKLSFEAWVKLVNLECVKLSGVSIFDLPDCNYSDWHSEGVTPKRAAKRAIKLANCEI